MVYQFKHCRVEVDLMGKHAVTIFEDGTRVHAAPHHNDEQRQTARRLGYGDDLAAMCREHEVLHTWLCERFGMPYSHTLWAVAHDQGPGCLPIHHQHGEEALVLAFQAYLNGRPADPALDSLTERGEDLEQLKAEALALLRGAAVSAAS